MSAHQRVRISCDTPDCGRWDLAGVKPTVKAARAALLVRGWRVGLVRASGEPRDYCPLHARRMAEELGLAPKPSDVAQ